ncbi:MAG: methionine synthase [Nitrospiraceae bacterium]|nr:methionine synthase [Nitrospiraceae bacterium]
MHTNPFKLKTFSTTGIGSLPHKDPVEACTIIIETFDIPFWPQLPRLSFRESMVAQYSEGMPFIKINPEKQSIWIDRNKSDDLERFYETYNEDIKIAISEDYAKGLHTFLNIVTNRFDFVKGHVTGPLTFTLGLRDRAGKAIFFDEELREIGLMLLKAKIRWQIAALKQFADNVIIFIDEPILSALGSTAYMGVDPAESARMLIETSDAIKLAGGISAIHCCGNADWGAVIRTGIDILNFDAYSYFETILIYEKALSEFIERGGYLAWGIVPTTDALNDETYDSMKEKLNKKINMLGKIIPEEKILSQSILTPSCGIGSRTIQDAHRIFQLLVHLKESFTIQ